VNAKPFLAHGVPLSLLSGRRRRGAIGRYKDRRPRRAGASMGDPG